MAIDLPGIFGKIKIDRSDLKDLGTDARAGMGDAEKAVKSGTSNMEKSLKGFKVAAGAALGAAGVAAGAAFVRSIDIEAANDKLSAQLGLTGERSAEIGKIAGDLYADAYGDSLESVNDALRAVLQNGLLPEDATTEQIESITAKVLDLSTAFEQDFGAVSRAVGQMLKTGLAKDADEALDLVTRGFQQGLDKSEDFLDTLNEYGTQFRKLGLDGETALGLLSQGIRAGARDVDVVADAIKEFSIRAVDGSELSKKGFEDLGLSAQKMTAIFAKGGPEASAALGTVLDKLRNVEDPAKRAEIAVALFGTQAEDLGDALFALDTSRAVGQLGDVEGAADKMGDTLNDNAKTKLEAFKRGMEQNVTNVLGGVVTAIDTLPGPLQTVAQTFAGLGDLASPFAPLLILLPNLKGALAGATAAIKAGSAALLTPPLGIVVAIGALVAALVLAYNESEEFRRIVDTAWIGVKFAVASAVDAIIGLLQGLVGFWFDSADRLLRAAEFAFGWMPGIGPKLREVRARFEEFRGDVESQLERAKNASEGWKNKLVADAARIGNSIRELPEVKSIDINAIDNVTPRIAGIQRALAGIRDETVYINLQRRDTGAISGRHSGGPVYHGGGHVQSFHDGGLKADEVMAKLQVGEFVLRRSAVRQLGTETLAALNRGQSGGNTYNVYVNGVFDLTNPNVAYEFGEKAVRAIQMVERAKS